jgi:hypothetical protein
MRGRKRPEYLSREWFGQWADAHPDGIAIPESEIALRFEMMKAQADHDRFLCETISFRAAALRLMKLSTLTYRAASRYWQAREKLILLLRQSGKHTEADAVPRLSYRRSNEGGAA